MSEAITVTDGGPTFDEVPAFRSGPDRMDERAFESCPWPVAAVAYWYRDHTWCEDPVCRCRRTLALADGLCAVAYRDGMFGLYRLTPDWQGAHPIDWHQIVRSHDRLTCAEFAGFRFAARDLRSAAIRWGQCPDAVAGTLAAINAAQVHGFF
jgi:hypothetical protein